MYLKKSNILDSLHNYVLSRCAATHIPYGLIWYSSQTLFSSISLCLIIITVSDSVHGNNHYEWSKLTNKKHTNEFWPHNVSLRLPILLHFVIKAKSFS